MWGKSLNLKKMLAGLLGTVILAFIAFNLGTSDEERIKNALDQLCELATFSESQSLFDAGSRVLKMGEYFTLDVEIEKSDAVAPISAIASRQQLKQVLLTVFNKLERASAVPRKVELTLAQDGQSATMTAGIYIRLQGMRGSEKFREAFDIRWVKRDERWQIKKVVRQESIHSIE